LNNKGQFSIIAALLISIIFVSTVILTYTVILNDSIQVQPQVLTAIDETNFAIKQMLGFSVGYYGSVIRVTGDTSFANQSTFNYTTSGLEYVANTHAEWGAGFSLTNLTVRTYWFNNTSYSTGYLSVTYNLTKLGIYGVQYAPSCGLKVQIANSTQSNQTSLIVTRDANEPITDLEQRNFQFFQYQTANSTWTLVSPSTSPVACTNGTYQIQPPAGIDANSYVIQVEDRRGIIVVASPFSSYMMNLTWQSTSTNITSPPYNYVNNDIYDVDSNGDLGTHSNFTAQQYGPDSVYDTLTEKYAVGSIAYENSGEGYSATGRNSYSFSYSLRKGFGNDRLVVVTVSWEDAEASASISTLTFGGTAMTKIANVTVGTGSSEYISLWYLLDPSLPSNPGSYSVAVTATETITREIYMAVAEYSGVKQMAPDDFKTHANTAPGNTAITLVAFADGSIVVAGAGEGGTNALTNTNNIGDLQQQVLTSSGSALGHHTNVVSGNITVGWNSLDTREGMVGAVWQPASNYMLDLEEQWTNVSYSDPRQKYLCVKTGAIDAEVTSVDGWNGSGWVNILSNLAANSWNNASVSSLIQSSAFTIRFRDGNKNSDSTQNSWQIDATLLAFNGTIQSTRAADTLTIELLQNGTMRWLGQSLQNTTQSMPIPPLPVKSIHVNQTMNGVDSEVPFQIEDWASDYLVPLGLTGNSSVFSGGNMIVFLVNSNVSRVTIWWNGSDLATQTPYAFVNRYFTGDNPSAGRLTNGILTLQFTGDFQPVVSSIGSVSCTATFMRMNNRNSIYGAGLAYIISSGVVRDIVQQEAEWGGGGVANCPNIYSHIVLTLPANATYYTFELRVLFVQSNQSRTISDLCPIELQSSFTQAQTENGTANGYPIVSTATGTFYNQSSVWAHHWSQLISGSNGAGIMFTDTGNNQLYSFDSLAGTQTGELRVNAAAGTIELLPVEIAPVSFTYPLNTIWCGAVSTFSNTTPIYQTASGQVSGSWINVEYPPTVAVYTGH
jgi:hypothetical protein